MFTETIIEIFKKNKSTLKETSIDKSKIDEGIVEYMTESTICAVNFDDVKSCYIDGLHVPVVPNSNDALLYDEEKSRYYFIEFKNGEIDSMKCNQIVNKIYDSLLIFLDIVNETIGYSRENVDYILVYNEEKEHTCKKYRKPNEIPHSPSRNKFVERLGTKAKEEYIQFGLGKYQKLYFRKVHTYTKIEFQKQFVDLYEII